MIMNYSWSKTVSVCIISTFAKAWLAVSEQVYVCLI